MSASPAPRERNYLHRWFLPTGLLMQACASATSRQRLRSTQPIQCRVGQSWWCNRGVVMVVSSPRAPDSSNPHSQTEGPTFSHPIPGSAHASASLVGDHSRPSGKVRSRQNTQAAADRRIPSHASGLFMLSRPVIMAEATHIRPPPSPVTLRRPSRGFPSCAARSKGSTVLTTKGARVVTGPRRWCCIM